MKKINVSMINLLAVRNAGLLTGASFLLSVSCTGKKDQQSQKPNFLLVIADDLGPEMGCYGDKQARTPNIDAFASQSYLFTKAYVTQSSSSPSRSSILTGLYPHQNGQLGLSHRGFTMHDEVQTISAILSRNGYFTGILGKIHVFPRESHLYDMAEGDLDTPSPARNSKFTKDSIKVLNSNFKEEMRRIEFTRMIERVADSAAVFIERAGKKPFFLQISYLDPHAPYYQQVDGYPKTLVDSSNLSLPDYSGSQTWAKNNIAGHYNSVSRVDEGFKMILDKLRESGRLDNTVIVFIGDNGAPFPKGKVTIYEGGLRVPFIMKLPGLKKQVVLSQMVSTVDIVPTFLEAASINVPEGLAGRSLLPLTRGDSQWRKYLFAEFNCHTEKEFFPQRSINDGKYKLIYSPLASVYKEEIEKTKPATNRYGRYANTPLIQLFDLETDPYENINLAEDANFQSEKERLLKELNAWQKQTNDPLVDQNTMELYKDIVSQFVSGKRDNISGWQYRLN